MTSVSKHYESHLAPVYVWMTGGMERALERGRAEVAAVCQQPTGHQLAIDLGAGFGTHSIPLADLGYQVLAIDSSGILLEELRSQAGTRSIKTVEGDLLAFRSHIEMPATLILCMGDTLTHLDDVAAVKALFAGVASSLGDGGRFIASFRDYSAPLEGADRFIAVRSDANRIMTCFLEYQDESVTVHDILHEREAAGWRQQVSAYRKLRLSLEWVIGALEAQGLQVRHERGVGGMIRIIAERSAGVADPQSID